MAIYLTEVKVISQKVEVEHLDSRFHGNDDWV